MASALLAGSLWPHRAARPTCPARWGGVTSMAPRAGSVVIALQTIRSDQRTRAPLRPVLIPSRTPMAPLRS